MEIERKIQKYYDEFDKYVIIPNEILYNIENVMYKKKKNNIIIFVKKIIAVIVGICTLTGGIVFAREYILKTFDLGKGVDTAIENGYIYTNNQNVEEKIKDQETKININEFFMDDTNMSAKFSIDINENLKEQLNISNIKNIELSDLIVTDENNNIIYCNNEETFKNFCQNNKLNYKFGEYTENYFNGGVNSILEPSSKENVINLTYNIYSGDMEKSYPKSKHLKYNFHNIKLITNYEDNTEYKILEGDWQIEVDTPEIMYNRTSITYNVVNCSDENIKINTAKVSDTGFEFGCTMHNIKLPEKVRKYKENISRKDISEEERTKIIQEYLESDIPLTPVSSYYDTNLGETIEKCTYIKNEKDEKFLISSNPGRKQRQDFINENSDFIIYETFDLTKYDTTDKLEIHLMFYDSLITINLEKNK